MRDRRVAHHDRTCDAARALLSMNRMARPNSPDVERERYGGESGRRFQEHSTAWVHGDGTDDPGLDDEPVDELVERLGREMGAAVNRAPASEHDMLRDYASALVRENTAANTPQATRPTRRARLSFFATAVWLVVAGVVFSLIFPPAGIVCFLMAGVAAVLAAVVGKGEVRSEPTSTPRDAA
jgi:hypothetical protein